MKIISWNINGIRSNIVCDGKLAASGVSVLDECNMKILIDKHDPDIICIQETKCPISLGNKILPNYDSYPYKYWNESKGTGHRGTGYSGTSIWSKVKPMNVLYEYMNLCNTSGRFMYAEYKEFSLINMYVPNSGTNFEYRTTEWDKNINDIINGHMEKPLIVTGDFNVVSTELDIWNPKTLEKAKSPGVFKEERDMFKLFLENYTDLYRYKYSDEKKYTWWDMRSKGRERGNGWRIDYFLLQDKYLDMVKDCTIDNSIMGSDHCPIILEIL